MKRVVWLPNWIGDAVMATPALRWIRQIYPNDELLAIYRGPVKETLIGTKLIDQFLADRSGSDSTVSEKWNFLRSIQQESCGEILLLTNSLRTAAVAASTRIPRRIGFNRDGRGWLLTEKVAAPLKKVPHPVLEDYLLLAARMLGQPDATAVSRRLLLSISADDQQHWEDFATRHCLDAGHYVCLNSGGAFGAAKHWPIQSFAELAKQIVTIYRIPVVMLCGPAERDLAREFMQLTQHPLIHSLAEESISIGLSKAVVKQARSMITTDSGPRHFAAAFDVPVITLFGPTHIEWSETFYDQAIHLQEQVDCGPCQQRTCPLAHHRCMKDLSVLRVLNAFAQIEHRRRIAVA